MPSVNSAGSDIYYEAHGQGTPLVLLHGFTAQSAQWKAYGYVRQLQQAYRVILIDLRGHGRSAKPHERDAYRLECRLADIAAVLRALAIGRAHFCGYSMGGWLAFGMALHYPGLVASLIVGGAHPYEEKFDAFRSVDGSDPQAFIAALEQFIGEPVGHEARAFILQNDLAALCAAAIDRDSFEPRLAEIQVPLLMFVGARDQRLAAVRRAAAALHSRELIVLPDAGHASALCAGKILIPQIEAFLRQA